MSERLTVDAAALSRLLHAAADRPDPELRRALVALVNSGTGPAPSPRPWLSVAEAAELLGVCERTVRDHAKADRLPHRRVGRRLLIHVSAVTGTDRNGAETVGPSGNGVRHGDTNTDPEPTP